jgi:hypothetical protein
VGGYPTSVVVLLRHVWLAAGLILAGCYEPFPPSGALCNMDEVDSCPTGQFCVRGTCRGTIGGVDGSVIPDIDAFIPDGSPADLDADGILNASDNCPNKHNPDQHDEDADTVGDVCDNCPHVANATQAKTGESATPNGAGDACDPRPQLPGDTIQKFYSFHVLPTGTTTNGDGAWVVEADTYRHTGGGFASLVVSDPRDKITVEVAGSLDSSTNNLGITVSAGEANGKYHECGYFECVNCNGAQNDFHNAFIDYWDGGGYLDLVGNHELQQRLSGSFTIRISADSTLDRITCTTSDSRGAPATNQANQASRLVPGAVGVYSDFASYRLRYLVIFGQP